MSEIKSSSSSISSAWAARLPAWLQNGQIQILDHHLFQSFSFRIHLLSPSHDLLPNVLIIIFAKEILFLWPNKMYILSVCPRDFLCSWDIWWDIYWMHRYQEANWVIHRSYQIMFLHFFFAKEILFRGQTSCTFFPYVPGTSIFIDRPQNVG